MGIIFCIACTQPVTAQTFTAHQNIAIGSNCNGYYDYLPSGYNNHGDRKYPLLIAFHGAGETGNGNTQLVRLTNTGIPQLISTNKFPASFTVSTGTYSFIVFAPQFKNIPVYADIDTVIKFALANYDVDLTRVYLTGYSMGGGAVWEYSGYSQANGNLFSAIVPVSGAFPSTPDFAAARNIAADNLPVWATHNLNDPTVPSAFTTTMIGYINQPTAPVPPALMTIFNANVHDAWTKTYNPLYIDPNTGFNMYSWMLQYQTRLATPPSTISPKITISPNPVTGTAVLKLDFPQTGNMNLRILNASGMLVYSMGFQKQAPHWEQHLSLFNLSSGMYILQVVGDKVNLHFQLIKE